MLGKLFARGKASKAAAGKAIIHQSVPEEGLRGNDLPAAPVDTSWMEAVPEPKAVKAVQPAVASPSPQISTDELPRETPQEVLEVRKEQASTGQPIANPSAASGARFPHGWLVVVEGEGAGEWFALEGGASTIGSAEGQTICLDFGDTSVLPNGHAILEYDSEVHSFILNSGNDQQLRLNGIPPTLPAKLRDGDILSVGGTGLRLVALCSPNFNWG